MNAIILRKPESIVLDNGTEISTLNIGWPESTPGQPYRKSEVYWTGSIVAIKTTAMQVSEYKEKKFKETNNTIIQKLMYVKKLKKLDDLKDLFIDEYKKSQTSFAEVDASIALITNDLFEI